MSTEIGRARYTFDRYGRVPEGIIPPMIVRSWERSKHLPREVRTPKLPPQEFKALLERYKDFMEAALPVEELLYVCSMRTMVGLTSADTYMIHDISRENYLSQLGRGGQEEVIGTNATNLCLREGIPVQTVRQENYALRYQHCSFASAPVFNEERKAIGVISLITTFGEDLPKNGLLMTGQAAKIIEQRMAGPRPLPLMSCAGISDMLEQTDNGVIICGDDGAILAANSAIAKALGFADSISMRGYQLGELFDNPETVNESLRRLRSGIENLEIKMVGRRLSCLFCERISSGRGDGSQFAALAFDLSRISQETGAAGKSVTDVWLPSESDAAIIGESPAWLRVKRMIEKISHVRSARVLIEGESGTGKEQIAKAIHSASGRKGRMITLNCGALPKELLQSELCGYADGAFTGAKKGGNPGKFELANGGTLFLDEIGEMPLEMQVALLRALEERQIVRLGSSKPISIDLSVIAATNKHLMDEVKAGRFREDLYYRLSAVMISAPPLRERRSDIPLLAEHLVKRLSDSMCIAPKPIAPEAMDLLLDYGWPGNVRELLNVLEHALVMEEGEKISCDTVREVLDIRSIQKRTNMPALLEENFKNMSVRQKTEIVTRVVGECGGNISKAAKRLKLSRNTIYNYLSKNAVP